MEKKIIKLCHVVAEKINKDNDIGNLLKLVFIPGYSVSVAELVIPGADLSQHLSTAGHEASRTSSMKYLMNGCLLLATEDGSTIEMIEEIRVENMFLFGAKVDEIAALREKGPALEVPLQFLRVVRMIRGGHFGLKDFQISVRQNRRRKRLFSTWCRFCKLSRGPGSLITY